VKSKQLFTRWAIIIKEIKIMAIIQKKKGGNYYLVYQADGKQIWKSTGTNNKKLARSFEDTARKQNSEDKLRRKMAELLGDKPPVQVETILATKNKRLKLEDVIQSAEKYKDISIDKKRAWDRFTEVLSKNIHYADQITADVAFAYLNKHYGSQKGKTWNNNRTYLNSIFRTILIDAGLSESPFQRIIQKKADSEHQRPFTEEECTAIIGAAKEPWRSAAIIAYYTGLRQKDCFALKWTNIKDDIINHKPIKTQRFNRAVQIPIHPELKKHLGSLPHESETVLGFVGKQSHKGRFTRYFGILLDELKISDNENGTVEFNCFRNTFITRCRAAGVQEHVIRGIVGHVDSDMTDLYSHDITGAMAIKDLTKGGF
jgi:integrase